MRRGVLWCGLSCLLFVLVLPMFFVDDLGRGEPWFCKWICPSGTLMAAWPLAVLEEGIRGMLGFLFVWKSTILVALLCLSLVVYRPFCRYLCPLGGMYGLLNTVSLYRYIVDEENCTHCGACTAACPMGIDVPAHPNSPECIRCGRCVEACAEGALHRQKVLKGQGEYRTIKVEGSDNE